MKKSPHHIKHQCSKAVKKAQKEKVLQEDKKMKDSEKKKFITSFRTNKIARGKVSPKKKSHMTSTDEVNWKTEPQSIHKEGEYWIKTLQKQILESARCVQRKFTNLRQRD